MGKLWVTAAILLFSVVCFADDLDKPPFIANAVNVAKASLGQDRSSVTVICSLKNNVTECQVLRTQVRRANPAGIAAILKQFETEVRKLTPQEFEKTCLVWSKPQDWAPMGPDMVKFGHEMQQACAAKNIEAFIRAYSDHTKEVEAQSCSVIPSEETLEFRRTAPDTWVGSKHGLCMDKTVTLRKVDKFRWSVRRVEHWPSSSSPCPGNNDSTEIEEFIESAGPRELGCKYFQ